MSSLFWSPDSKFSSTLTTWFSLSAWRSLFLCSSFLLLLSPLFYQYCLHKLHILSVSPTTSARSRLLSLPPWISLLLIWLFSQSQVYVSIIWGCFILPSTESNFFLLNYCSFTLACLSQLFLLGFALHGLSFVIWKIFVWILSPSGDRNYQAVCWPDKRKNNGPPSVIIPSKWYNIIFNSKASYLLLVSVLPPSLQLLQPHNPNQYVLIKQNHPKFLIRIIRMIFKINKH